MRSSIVEKLTEHLQLPILREADAVYLMVEIRKILDHAYQKNDFTIIRFYADWFLHTEKSRSLQHIEPVIRSVYEGIADQIEKFPLSSSEKLPIVSFMEMEDLKAEMENLFQKENLPPNLFEKEGWKTFVEMATAVLIDQPIKNPIEEVSEFRFLPAAPNCVRGVIEFAIPVIDREGEKMWLYKFGNAS